MILADTNVISEPLKPRPLKRVVEWLSRQDEYDMYVASVCQAELLFGIALLSPGRRRQAMEAGWDRMLDDVFQGRILPFDAAAAVKFAELVSSARKAGHSISFPDGQIAAIAAVRGMRIATRDTAPFIAMGLPVIDPWLDLA